MLWALARTLARQRLEHTYRVLWSPGTLGPLCWLARNRETLDRVQNGLAISCVGDPGPLRYKRSRRGDAPVDRAAAHVLGREPGQHRRRLAAARRRRAAVLLAGVRPARRHALAHAARALPRVPLLGRRPRSRHGRRRSAASYRAALEIIDVVETNASFQNRSPYGEPQLGRRGLYQSVPDGTYPEARVALAAEPVRRAPRPARDRRAVGPAVRRGARGRGDARAARPPRARWAEGVEVAIVTGASRGIGRATALALAEDGFRVALLARSAGGLRETRELVERRGGAALDLVADVTDAEAVGEAVAAVGEQLGPVGQCSSTTPARCGRSARSGRCGPTTGGRTSRRASAAPTTCCRAVVPGMIERGRGRIVNVTSYAALRPAPYQTGYACGKAAVAASPRRSPPRSPTTASPSSPSRPGSRRPS